MRPWSPRFITEHDRSVFSRGETAYLGKFNHIKSNQLRIKTLMIIIYVLSNPHFVFWNNHALIKHLNCIERSELAPVDSNNVVYMVSLER